MLHFLSFNTINREKPSTNRKELANNNNRNPDNKPSAKIKSLVGEKNINQDSNASVHKQKKAKIAGAINKKAIPSNFCLYKHANSKFGVPADMLDLQ